jgi:pumilio RNA-binding family
VRPLTTLRVDYVLQRALRVVEGEQKEALLAEVRPLLVTMRRYSSAYSKHLLASGCSIDRAKARADLAPVERLLDHEVDIPHAVTSMSIPLSA